MDLVEVNPATGVIKNSSASSESSAEVWFIECIYLLIV